MVKLKKYKNPQRKMENKQLIKRRDKRLIMDYLLTMTLVTILITKMNILNKMRKKIKIYSRTLDRKKQRKKIIKNNNNKSSLSKILKPKKSQLPPLPNQNNRLSNSKILSPLKAPDKKIIKNNPLKMNSKKKKMKKK